jgi:hypothetical protein
MREDLFPAFRSAKPSKGQAGAEKLREVTS